MVALIQKWTTEGIYSISMSKSLVLECHNIAPSAEAALVLSHSHIRWKYMSSYSVPTSRLRRANLSVNSLQKYGFQSSILQISAL